MKRENKNIKKNFKKESMIVMIDSQGEKWKVYMPYNFSLYEYLMSIVLDCSNLKGEVINWSNFENNDLLYVGDTDTWNVFVNRKKHKVYLYE